jgi:hypothetical protein
MEKKLTEIALREQTSSTPNSLLDLMLNFVAQRYLDGKLSKEEAEQFFLNTLNADLKTRPVVAAGDPIPLRLTYAGRGPSMGWSFRLTGQQVKVGDYTFNAGGSIGGSGVGGMGSITVYANPQPVGEVDVEAQVLVEVFQVAVGAPRPPVWSKTVIIKKKMSVVAANRDDMVKLIDQPDLSEIIRKSIRIEKLLRKEPGAYEMHVQIDKPGTDVAFSVFIRAGGKEHRIGEVSATAQSNVGSSLYRYELGDVPLGKVQVILRSDTAVARKTIELTQIWKGEIIIDDVELIEEKKKPN